jgi:hypothetical protein
VTIGHSLATTLRRVLQGIVEAVVALVHLLADEEGRGPEDPAGALRRSASVVRSLPARPVPASDCGDRLGRLECAVGDLLRRDWEMASGRPSKQPFLSCPHPSSASLTILCWRICTAREMVSRRSWPKQIGSKATNVIVEAMIAAVIGEKHKLEQQNGGTA